MNPDLAFLVENVVNGALVGLMYSLVAVGIVLIYKSSGVVNFAQGSMVMLGAYLVWGLQAWFQIPIWVSILLAMVIMALLGMGIERLALRSMIGQPIIMIITLTLGLEIFLRGLAPAVWGTATKPIDLGISAAPLFLGPVLINRLYLVGGITALLLVGILMWFFRTRLGIVLRAVSDDQTASWSVGISVERAVGLSWALSGVVSVIAGVLWAGVQGVGWTLSLLLVKAFAVAILGGLDSIGGAVVAGLMLGIMESVIPFYLDAYVGGGTRDVVAVMVILLTILIRPYGLFGREIIERV